MQELRSLLENACSDSLQGPLMQVGHQAAGCRSNLPQQHDTTAAQQQHI